MALEIKSFHSIASHPQESILTSSFKNLQESEKAHFQTLRGFVFELKVTSRPFSKISSISNFRLEQFSKLFPPFPENGVDFFTQIILLKRENCLFKPSKHSFLTSAYLQNYFLGSSYDKPLI